MHWALWRASLTLMASGIHLIHGFVFIEMRNELKAARIDCYRRWLGYCVCKPQEYNGILNRSHQHKDNIGSDKQE